MEKPHGQRSGPGGIHFTAKPGPTVRGQSSPGHLMIKALSRRGGAFFMPGGPSGAGASTGMEKPHGQRSGPGGIHFTAKPGPTVRGQSSPGHLMMKPCREAAGFFHA